MAHIFVLPKLPPSANDLYEPHFVGRRMVGMKLKDGALRWQQEVLQNGYIPRIVVPKGATLHLEMEFHYHLDKRRFDVTNLWKLVQDTIAKRIGFNDRTIRNWKGRSVHDEEEEFIVVKLSIAGE